MNIVFIAMSLDGYIAKLDGTLDWLNNYPNPDNEDFGYDKLIDEVDAIVMGKNTYRFVEYINPWPNRKKVFVVSKTVVPNDNIEVINNYNPQIMINELKIKGFNHLYIDGGKLINEFLFHDLIDRMIISIVPILIGSGIKLFNNSEYEFKFNCISSKRFNNGIVQIEYRRHRDII